MLSTGNLKFYEDKDHYFNPSQDGKYKVPR